MALCWLLLTKVLFKPEISEIPGVSNVDVTLETGVVEISSDRELGRDEVSDAVSEAGYELV